MVMASANLGALDRLVPHTLLSLDRFARIVSYSPILFHQVVIMHNELQRDSSCSDPVLQYTWQYRAGGRPGRTEIAQAISQAEDLIYRQLKFPIAPDYFTDEIDFIGVNGRYGIGFGYDRAAIRTNNRWLIELGAPKYTPVTTAQIAWIDGDGDSYPGVGVIDLVDIAEDVKEDELHAFYPDVGPDKNWEIRPITVKIDRTTGAAQIAFARHLCVLPELQERLDATGVDGMDDTNFIDAVTVYRLTTDRSQIGHVEYMCGGCGLCTACTSQSVNICGGILDPRNGLVALQPAMWDETNAAYVPARCVWVTPPARVILNYRAGFTNKRIIPGEVTPRYTELERATAYLALSLLDRDWLTCEQIRNLQAHWRFDLAKSESSPAQSSSFRLDPYILRCPLGTTRAAIYAWRVLQPLMVGEAVLSL